MRRRGSFDERASVKRNPLGRKPASHPALCYPLFLFPQKQSGRRRASDQPLGKASANRAAVAEANISLAGTIAGPHSGNDIYGEASLFFRTSRMLLRPLSPPDSRWRESRSASSEAQIGRRNRDRQQGSRISSVRILRCVAGVVHLSNWGLNSRLPRSIGKVSFIHPSLYTSLTCHFVFYNNLEKSKRAVDSVNLTKK